MADDGSFFGSLIGAGANLLGGWLNRGSAEKLQRANIANQLNFAQNSIAWRVADAKRAGISPLAALGAPGMSFSNVVGDSSFGEGVAKAGQDLGRAANSLTPVDNRAAQLEERLMRLKIAGAEQDVIFRQLENSKLARSMAAPGQGPGVSASYVPLPVAAPHSRDTLPLWQDYRDRLGNRITLPSEKASQAMQNLAAVPGAVPVVMSGIAENYGANARASMTNAGYYKWLRNSADVVRGRLRDFMGTVGRDYMR